MSGGLVDAHNPRIQHISNQPEPSGGKHLGRIKQRARTTTILDPRVVNVQHDWWFPEKPEAEPSLLGVWESSANVITDDDPATLDPLIGSWQHTGLMCRVYKCEEGE
jgi:hypothetical protein